jgi:hypothetical protein
MFGHPDLNRRPPGCACARPRASIFHRNNLRGVWRLDTALDQCTSRARPFSVRRRSLPSFDYARALLSLIVLLAITTFCACTSTAPSAGTSSSPAKNRITQLNVITVPVALDLDGKPGPDGVAVKLYANNPEHPKALRMREGTLEFIMFDGTFHGRTNPPPIVQSFTFAASEFRLHEFNSKLGWGYEFTLRWGTNLPTQRIMSIGARYTAPNSRPIVSRTSSVTVLNK